MRSTSRPVGFIPLKEGAGLDDLGEKKSLNPAGFLNPDRPARSLDSIPNVFYRLPSIQVIAYIFSVPIREIDSSSDMRH